MATVQNCQEAWDLHESSQQQCLIDILLVQNNFDYFANFQSIGWRGKQLETMPFYTTHQSFWPIHMLWRNHHVEQIWHCVWNVFVGKNVHSFESEVFPWPSGLQRVSPRRIISKHCEHLQGAHIVASNTEDSISFHRKTVYRPIIFGQSLIDLLIWFNAPASKSEYEVKNTLCTMGEKLHLPMFHEYLVIVTLWVPYLWPISFGTGLSE